MRRTLLSWLVVTVCMVSTMFYISGCSYSFTYQGSGIVRNAIDGKPLPGITVHFDGPMIGGGIPVTDPATKGITPDGVTGPDGSFRFTAHDSHSPDGPVTLFFHGTGYVTERFSIRLNTKSHGDEPTNIFVGATLRPAPMVTPASS